LIARAASGRKVGAVEVRETSIVIVDTEEHPVSPNTTLDAAFRLDGKVAVVTGAGGGIGSAIADVLARAGARVACVDLRAPEDIAARIRSEGGQATALACDVSDEKQTITAVKSTLQTWSAIHVLVNGASNDDPTGDITVLKPDEWAKIFAVHVTGAYLMSRAALPAIIAAGGGSIIHIASQMARVGARGRPGYCAAKGALLQLAKAMAVDHADDNVRVNTLSPGATQTRRMVLRHGDMEDAVRYNAPKHLLNRLGQPMEMATAALFLASEASSFMTGTDLLVDGGYTAF
jgi:NAD(P)-dependent dehydrogenase (short-subunit alcohol dehydrogenase family)